MCDDPKCASCNLDEKKRVVDAANVLGNEIITLLNNHFQGSNESTYFVRQVQEVALSGAIAMFVSNISNPALRPTVIGDIARNASTIAQDTLKSQVMSGEVNVLDLLLAMKTFDQRRQAGQNEDGSTHPNRSNTVH